MNNNMYKGLNNTEDFLAVLKAKQNKKEETPALDYCMSTTRHIFSSMAGNKSTGVGIIDNEDTNIKLLIDAPNTAVAAIKGMYQPKGISGKKKYSSIPTYSALDLYKKTADTKYFTDGKEVVIKVLDDKTTEKFKNELKTSEITNESVRQMLYDASSLNRRGSELSLDSAKKGGEFIVDHNLSNYRPLTLQELQFEFKLGAETEFNTLDEVEDGVFKLGRIRSKHTPSNYLNVYRNTPSKKNRTYYNDTFNQIQNELVSALEDILDVAGENYANLSIDQKEIERLNKYKGYGPVDELTNIMSDYHTTSIAFNSIVNDPKSTQDDKDVAKVERQAVYEKLGNKLRQLFMGCDPVTMASIVKFFSCLDRNKNFNNKSRNQFAVSLIAPELLTMITEIHADINVMGYKINVDNGLEVGKSYLVVNGVVIDNDSILNFENEMGLANGEFKIAVYAETLEGFKILNTIEEVEAFELDNANNEYRLTKYAVKNIEFVIPKADFSKRLFTVVTKKKGDYRKLIEDLKVGETMNVSSKGTFAVGNNVRYKVKYGEFNNIGEQITGQDLLGVSGVINFVKVVESEDYPAHIIFELDEVNMLSPEEDLVLGADELDANDIPEVEFMAEDIKEEDSSIIEELNDFKDLEDFNVDFSEDFGNEFEDLLN